MGAPSHEATNEVREVLRGDPLSGHVFVLLNRRKTMVKLLSDKGAERAAIAYTIIGSCKLVDVNPVEYLADVLPRLARKVRLVDVPDLLPAAWTANRPA